MLVRMELSRIIISEINDQQVIYLKEKDGERQFPSMVGIFEATSIDRRVKGLRAPRPLTHDLILGVVQSMGGRIQDIVVCDLEDQTYYARLRIRRGKNELIEVDARPSDAIAVAMTSDPPIPIFVSEEVLAAAAEG